MDILFLTPEIPYPPRGGGTIKSASLLSHLAGRHRIEVLCFTRRPLTADQRRWMAERGSLENIRLDRGRTPINLLRSYASGVPLSIERNRSPRMSALVSERLRAGGYGAVFVDGWLMAQYLPNSFRGLRLLHQHNAEHVMWGRQLDLERGAVRRALLRIEYGRVRRYEASILPRFHVVFAVSEPDRRSFVDLGTDPERVRVLPNVADAELLARPALSPTTARPLLLFIGTLSWAPNLSGLERFIREVLPTVRRRIPGLRLLVAGRGAEPRLVRLAARTEGVDLLGAVADPEGLYRSARVFVDPSLGGGGTRVKILNAMARGLPVVATTDAVEGLEAASGEHLLVADGRASMADSIARLMSDAGLSEQLSRRGRLLVRRRYVPEAAFGVLDDVLVAGAGEAPARP